MKKLSIFTLIAAVFMCLLTAVGLIFLIRANLLDGIAVQTSDYFNDITVILNKGLVLAMFVIMFNAKFHRKTALVGGFGAFFGMLSALMGLFINIELFDQSPDPDVYHQYSLLSSLFSRLQWPCILVAFSLLYVELRHDKWFKRFALTALVILVLSYLYRAFYYTTFRAPTYESGIIFQMLFMLSSVSYLIVYMFALSFAYKRTSRPTQQ
jgi:hypothetical protein